MKNKILVVGITLLFAVMMVTPALAEPLKVPAGKNKNINEMMRSETSVYLFTNPFGSFKEFYSNSETGAKWSLMRKNASQCSIGGAVDASDWDFPHPPSTPHPQSSAICFMMLVDAGKWVYLNQAGAHNLLYGFFGNPVAADMISSQFPDGVYFKADWVG